MIFCDHRAEENKKNLCQGHNNMKRVGVKPIKASVIRLGILYIQAVATQLGYTVEKGYTRVYSRVVQPKSLFKEPAKKFLKRFLVQ